VYQSINETISIDHDLIVENWAAESGRTGGRLYPAAYGNGRLAANLIQQQLNNPLVRSIARPII
jgi:hypothetical protein